MNRNEQINNSVLFVGGPDTGKTNYLFRLWLGMYEKVGFLHSSELPQELEYLQSGVESLQGGAFAPHTSRDVMSTMRIPFLVPSLSGIKGELVIPDCSGEEWVKIYQNREWSNDWEELVEEGTGFLVFLRVASDVTSSPLDWITCERLFGSHSGDLAPRESDRVEISTQAMLVDWIQMLIAVGRSKAKAGKVPRFGVVISAWDLVPAAEQQLGPEQYLRENFPLLSQFMRANSREASFSTFGLSIVGGDFINEPGFRDRYLVSDPSHSGFVTFERAGTIQSVHDVTLPVAWAMGLVD